MTPELSRFAACTIVASNYLSRAIVMHDSLKKYNPGVDFWLLLIDDNPLVEESQQAVDEREIHILRVNEIGVSDDEISNFRFMYDLTEVSTAFKPWTLEVIAKRSGLDSFYIDPDIEFYGAITGLIEAAKKHQVVLTPHVLEPMKRDGAQPAESDIMGSGIYNLGFLGVNHGAAEELSRWWKERLLRECYSDPAKQRFTDQRWIDFVPALFDSFISKDETFNVAYWNADQRPVTYENGKFTVRGKPVSFFHFSGYSEKAPHLLTRHHAGNPRVLLSRNPALSLLTRKYSEAVRQAEQECGEVDPGYPYNQFSSGDTIPLSLRRAFLIELVRAESVGDSRPVSPFGTKGEDAFFDWLLEPVSTNARGVKIPRLFLLLRETRDDLKAAFPDPKGRDAIRLITWFEKGGIKSFGLPKVLKKLPKIEPDAFQPGKLLPGVEIVGYLQTESGVGQAGRLLARGLKSSSVPFETLSDSTAPSRQKDPFQSHQTGLKEGESYDCCVLCVNADSVASVRRRLGNRYLKDRRVAGLWFWEIETFPQNLHSAFKEVNEVWVASRFIFDTLAPISPIPVHYIPLPFGKPERCGELNREELGIPEGFFFLFSFDFHSVFRRKNPLALIEAFKIAFEEGEGPSLVIKGINAESHVPDLEALIYAAAERSDIIILSEYLDASTNQSLTAACDCYVSLHRSEGLGLTMAEAMCREKPVIATAYSGNMDFMDDENSYLCRYEMVKVGKGAAPYSQDARWADPDIDHAASLMRHVFLNPEEAAEKGRVAAASIAEKFNPEACARVLEERWSNMRALRGVEGSGRQTESKAGSVKTKLLEKLVRRNLNIRGIVPSGWTLIFQSQRRCLKKIFRRLERHFKPFQNALVDLAVDHERRLSNLEKTTSELREQNEALQKVLADSKQKENSSDSPR